MILTTAVPEFADLRARDDLARFIKPDGVGVELGVAEGVFSERILSRAPLAYLYSIDMYAGDRGHDIEQYRRALQRLWRFRDRNAILKMRFDEALPLFEDSSLDFVYVDGYAHTGEEGGETFRQWWPKLKSGGIFSGDDYDAVAFPSVVTNLDTFLSEVGLEPYVIPFVERGSIWSEYPTWFVRKP